MPTAGAVVAGGFGAAVVVEGRAAVGFGAAVVLVGAGGVVVFERGVLGFLEAGAAVPGEVLGGAEGEAVAVDFAVRMSRPPCQSQDVFPPSVRCPFQDAFLPSVHGPPAVDVMASAPPSPMHAMAADGTATATALIARTATAMGRRRVFLRCFGCFLMRTSFGRLSLRLRRARFRTDTALDLRGRLAGPSLLKAA
ncbi:hypothetical protein ASD48_41045 [Streptomyces sp. Root1310]|nr:hypothetical protein ASD48_41045 [Streptomyces sp. Root1310]